MNSHSSDPERVSQAVDTTSPASPAKIDPLLALELRLRWLEALILGVKQGAISNLKHGETLSRLAEMVQQKLDKAVQGNEGLTKFMNQCIFSCLFSNITGMRYLVLGIDDKHAPLLMPSFVLSGTIPDPPTYDKMSAEEMDAFLTEMEPEIRAADRDMLEIEALEKKGVTGAGRLLGTV